jgi:hypothetical protein
MCWIKNVLLFPFAVYLVILKFVFRVTVKIFTARMFRKDREPDPDDRSRKNSSARKEFGQDPRDVGGSGAEPRSRHDSGIGIRSRNNSGGGEPRSRHNSGKGEVRSRNNSGGGEPRSRNDSGGGPGPGLDFNPLRFCRKDTKQIPIFV